MAVTHSGSRPIQIKCKKCGQMAPSTDFKLDAAAGTVVCPKCYNSKSFITPKPKEEVRQEMKVEPKRPTGWDKDDDVIDTLYREKQKNMMNLLTKTGDVKYEMIPGTSFLLYKCERCRYKFKYNTMKHFPSSCPACNTAVPKELYRLYLERL